MIKELQLKTYQLTANVPYPDTVPGDFIGIQRAWLNIQVIIDNSSDRKLMQQGQTAVFAEAYNRVTFISSITQTVKIYIGFGRMNNIPDIMHDSSLKDIFRCGRDSALADWSARPGATTYPFKSSGITASLIAFMGTDFIDYCNNGQIKSVTIHACKANENLIRIVCKSDILTGRGKYGAGTLTAKGVELAGGESYTFLTNDILSWYAGGVGNDNLPVLIAPDGNQQYYLSINYLEA
jgi:hypothetical protein